MGLVGFAWFDGSGDGKGGGRGVCLRQRMRKVANCPLPHAMLADWDWEDCAAWGRRL